jgi:hypothetical protein
MKITYSLPINGKIQFRLEAESEHDAEMLDLLESQTKKMFFVTSTGCQCDLYGGKNIRLGFTTIDLGQLPG